MRRLVAAGVVLAVAYWLWKRFFATDLQAGSGVLPSLSPPSSGPSSSNIAAAPAPADLAGDEVPYDPSADVLLHNRGYGSFQNDKYQLMDLFYHQWWLPASRLPLSALVAADFKQAARFLSYQMDRNGEPDSDRYKDLQAIYNDQQTGALITKILGGIVANIPYVGEALAMVANDQSSDLSGAALGTLTQAHLAGQLRGVFDPHALDAASKMWLAPSGNGGEAVADANAIYMSVQVGPLNPDGNWVNENGEGFAPHARWLSICQSGYILPWLSYELGMREDLHTRINLRARLLRALDLLTCMFQPIIPVNGKLQHLYCYTNSFYGDVVGSVFPPIWPEDVRLVNGGRTYDYDGTDITASIQQANAQENVARASAANGAGPGSTYKNNTASPISTTALSALMGITSSPSPVAKKRI